jgi:hypothetical protein
MNGEGGTLEIAGVVAGTLNGWSLRKGEDNVLVFTAEGSFRSFWLSVGATRAVAMAAKTQQGDGRRPARSPAKPITLHIAGDIQELTGRRVVLTNVKLSKGAD